MAKMAATAGEFFARRARRYDEQAALGLPGYHAMLDELTRSLPDAPNAPAGPDRILELGCGTGALTERLARRFPAAQIHAIDAAQEMIEIALERMGALPQEGRPALEAPEVAEISEARVSFEVVAFEDAILEAGSFAIATGSMSLHHLPDKLPFYTRICESLRATGYFVFADELTGVVPYVQDLHWKDWLDFASQPGHLAQDELDEVLAHCETLDHYETLPDQLALLSNAGFARADCIWRASNYAIFAAQKRAI